jgi:hypothetical protein
MQKNQIKMTPLVKDISVQPSNYQLSHYLEMLAVQKLMAGIEVAET